MSNASISYGLNNFTKPSVVRVDNLGDFKSNVMIEPFQSGFGLTIGNAMRRVLMSSLSGAAVESIEIDGVVHEYSVIQGVKEDVTEIMLNVKRVVFRVENLKEHVLYLKAEGMGPVTAGMIICDDGIEVINKDLVICTLSCKGAFNMKLNVNVGSGYVPAKVIKKHNVAMVHKIYLNALYNPIRSVNPIVESMRIGDITNYDKLILEIETNGSIGAVEAVECSAKILQQQLSCFTNLSESDSQEDLSVIDLASENKCDLRFLKKVDELDLSVRASNCLKNEEIVYIGDLAQKTDDEMLRTPNFGRKSMTEIRQVLNNMGLDFNMEIEDWDIIRKEEIMKEKKEK